MNRIYEIYEEDCSNSSRKLEWEIKQELADIHKSELVSIGEDIRNKLGPLRNLISMIELYNRTIDMELRASIMKFIVKEIEQSKKSISYLTGIL